MWFEKFKKKNSKDPYQIVEKLDRSKLKYSSYSGNVFTGEHLINVQIFKDVLDKGSASKNAIEDYVLNPLVERVESSGILDRVNEEMGYAAFKTTQDLKNYIQNSFVTARQKKQDGNHDEYLQHMGTILAIDGVWGVSLEDARNMKNDLTAYGRVEFAVNALENIDKRSYHIHGNLTKDINKGPREVKNAYAKLEAACDAGEIATHLQSFLETYARA